MHLNALYAQQIDLFQTAEEVRIAAGKAEAAAEAADKAAATTAAETAASAAERAAQAATHAALAASSAVASANGLTVTAASARAAADAAKMAEAAQKTALISASDAATQHQEGRKLGAALAHYVALNILQENPLYKGAVDALLANYPASQVSLKIPAVEIQKGMLQGILSETMRNIGPSLYRIDEDAADYLQKTLADYAEAPLTPENFAKLLGMQLKPELVGTSYSNSARMRFHQPAAPLHDKQATTNDPVRMHTAGAPL